MVKRKKLEKMAEMERCETRIARHDIMKDVVVRVNSIGDHLVCINVFVCFVVVSNA